MDTNVQENWTEIIKPTNNFLDFKIREIWDYRDLIVIFVKRDIISVYKQTVLGPLWFFLSPLFTVLIYTFVFSGIANISTDGIPAPLFYLAGTTLWSYFQNCFTGVSSTFVSNANIFGKVYFPRLISPISLTISNLFKFGIQFTLFLILWVYYLYVGDSIKPNIYLVLVPALVIISGGIALGVGIIISALTTKYRDLTYFLSFGISLLMYATPVIYPVSSIPEKYKPIFIANPIAPIIEAFRFAFTGSGNLDFKGLIYSFIFMIVFLIIGIFIFNKVERDFMDTV